MLVSSSKYKKLEMELLTLRFQYAAHVEKWNTLVKRINAKGGEAFLESTTPPSQFTDEEIKALLQLCHPDKHGGKDSATRMTQKLLSLR